ncbi:nuclear pore protein 84/107 [Amylostereum chailletii]|nr:nuclear pore protein 84/107 [Amylostereum chailletii]
MSTTLYTSCADVLALFQTHKDDLALLLDPEAGFAPRIRQICLDQLPSAEASQDEIDALRMESNTWGLLQALVPTRKTDPEPRPTARQLLSENPYTPTSALAQAVMHASRTLSELVVVREWLHDTAPPPPCPEPTTGYWRFTQHRLMHALRTGNSGKAVDGIVKEMDPDAVAREGRALAADDANHEKALAQTLYAYVRAGKLDAAVELCREVHQPWRAASIRGALLFSWRAIATEPRDEDDEQEETALWQGNRWRNLWKTACTRAALDPHLPDTERALYAALAPSASTAGVLEAACRTWEDNMWAQVSILCEDKQTATIASLGGGFWEGGVPAVETALDLADGVDEEREEEAWRAEVEKALQALATVAVDDGLPADNAFHMSQLHIILDRTDALLDDFAVRLRDGLYDPTSSEYPTMTRFFAHLCLFLQMIDIQVSPLATQIILEAYLQVLEAAGQRDLIAMYAGALGDNAVERYALFLTSLELSADVAERRLALTRAREHGLDVERVAVVTAERTIEHAFALLPPALKGPLPRIAAGKDEQPSAAETLLLRSIEWTVFGEGTYATALEQTNVILRFFLASGRVQVARLLLRMLPPELAAIQEPEERATEYHQYRQFFDIWEGMERALETRALEAPQMTRDTRAQWLADYRGCVDYAREKIVKLLTTDWLIPDSEDAAPHERRLRKMRRIRQLYVPEFIFRLHALLLDSRAHIPENVKHALLLANVVADSRYRLYEDFSGPGGRRLGEYLDRVRGAVCAGLEGGGSDPLRAASV